MIRRLLFIFVLAIAGLALSQCSSPIVATKWQAPENRGFTGVFAQNDVLSSAQHFSLGNFQGPEDIAVNALGEVVASSQEGYILKFDPDSQSYEPWAFTGGKPLGMRFDSSGNLIVADALLGLLAIDSSANIRILANHHQGQPFGFVDAVAIASNGEIYFTDASSRYSVREHLTPEAASHLDILAHGGHGAVYQYSPNTGTVVKLVDGLQFANGIVVSHDEQALLVNETGRYRVIKISISSDSRGKITTLVNNLPGFPDNISRHYPSGYWLGLIAPRNALLDKLSQWPRLRESIAMLPKAAQPKAQAYGHIVLIDNAGEVEFSLQDPSGTVHMTTGAMPDGNALWISSLTASTVAHFDLTSLPTQVSRPNGE